MSAPQFLGIMLVHDEDLLLARAARNALAFCDRLFIAEHRSGDGTWEQAQELARAHPGRVEAARIRHARESQEMLQPFAGTPTWVLGVDGDEWYDPAGLRRTRAEILTGAWDPWWTVFGNVLNCVELDPESQRARGHLAPPCRSMTKLYNFAALAHLDPAAPQRLMGRADTFRPGYHAGLRWERYKEQAWEAADFRCLHLCFLPRSSRQAPGAAARENLTELRRHSPLAWLRRLAAWAQGRPAPSSYKAEKYRRGPVVAVDASPFLA